MYEEASFAYSLKSEWIIPLGWGGCHNRGFNLFTFTVESDLLPYWIGIFSSHVVSSRGNCFCCAAVQSLATISICLIEAFVKPIIQAQT